MKPAYLKQIPSDSFTDKRLIYRRTHEDYLQAPIAKMTLVAPTYPPTPVMI
ncbi:hypothetical protein N9B17_02660 [Rhodopirellula sp.]|nr:hypothetical protein [Rhodopirellula sp.]